VAFRRASWDAARSPGCRPSAAHSGLHGKMVAFSIHFLLLHSRPASHAALTKCTHWAKPRPQATRQAPALHAAAQTLPAVPCLDGPEHYGPARTTGPDELP
jgi:hypothetical protein